MVVRRFKAASLRESTYQSASYDPGNRLKKKIPDVGDVTTIANKYIVHILHDETDLFVFQKCRGGHHRQKALYRGLRR